MVNSVIIDGKAVAAKFNRETALMVEQLKAKKIVPALAVILAGEDPASQVYVRAKVKKCAELGIRSEQFLLPVDVKMEEMLSLVESLNSNEQIDGILVQSPPPPQIDEKAIIEAISPAKDVDCFHPENVGKILIGETEGFKPCTPRGVQILLQESNIDTRGKNVVIVGRSNIVGKPLAAMLMQKGAGADATVTVVHSRTLDIAEYTRRADILIAALGKPEFIKGEMIKPGAAVIDVGINRITLPDGSKKLVGDVDFADVTKVAGFITPVPGGVGPMTIAVLMRNTVVGAKLRRG